MLAPAWVKMSYRDGGLLHGNGYMYRVGQTPKVPGFEMTAEDYRRLIAALLEYGLPVTIGFEATGKAMATIVRGRMVMKDGEPEYPSLRSLTRNNPDRPDLAGMREWFSFSTGGDSRTYVLARDVVFMKAIVNTFIFVLVVAPLQGGLALGLALLINQRHIEANGATHSLRGSRDILASSGIYPVTLTPRQAHHRSIMRRRTLNFNEDKPALFLGD